MKVKRRNNGGTKQKIQHFKEKYGDAVQLIHAIDRKPGNPTQWKADYTRMIFWLALTGMNESEMANIIGVHESTFDRWKQNYPDFLEALTAGKHESIALATNALYQVGLGYSHDAVKIIPNRVKTYDPHTGRVIKEETKIIREAYVKHYPPNVTALVKFLAARMPEVWGDKSEVRHTGEVTHSVDYTKLSKKEIKLMKKLKKASESKENQD